MNVEEIKEELLEARIEKFFGGCFSIITALDTACEIDALPMITTRPLGWALYFIATITTATASGVCAYIYFRNKKTSTETRRQVRGLSLSSMEELMLLW